MRMKISCEGILRLVCLFSVIIVLYIMVTYGQARIDSDIAMMTLLTKSRVESRTLFPSTWYYADGAVGQWGLPYLILYLLYLFISDQCLLRVLANAVFLLYVLAWVVAFFKVFYKNDGWALLVPLFLLFVSGQNETTIYQGAYIGHIMRMAQEAILIYYGIKKRNAALCILYVLIALQGSIGGIRATAEFVLPFFSAYVLTTCFDREGGMDGRQKWKECVFAFLLIMVQAFVGNRIYQWLCTWNHVSHTHNDAMLFAASLNECYANFEQYVINLFACFGYSGGVGVFTVSGLRNILSVFSCLLLCFILPVLQGRILWEEDQKIRFFYNYVAIHNIIIFIMTVFTGLLSPRYLLSTVYGWLLISSYYVYTYWMKKGREYRIFWTMALTCGAIVECAFLLPVTVGWREGVKEEKAFAQTLLDRGLYKGYASYWNAYGHEIYSDLRLRFGAVSFTDRYVRPYLWLVDARVYEPEPLDTFLLLDPEEEEAFGDGIGRLLGEPKEKEMIGIYAVYIYDHDISADFKQEGQYRAAEFYTNEEAEMLGRQIRLRPGGIVYGPYESIPAGEYMVKLQGQGVGNCDAGISSNHSPSAIQFEESERSEDTISLRLSVTEDVDDLEFIVINHTDDASYYFEEVRLQMIEDGDLG